MSNPERIFRLMRLLLRDVYAAMIPQLAFGPGAQVNYREAVLRCEITELIGVRTNQLSFYSAEN